MTVLPGSLDYLYYNGILDHIPYEAYAIPAYPVYPTPVMQYPYDSFESPNPYRNIVDESKKENPAKSNKSVIIKGLISAGVIIGTCTAMLHGIKKSGFLKKLNPVNWFKKK